MLLIQNTCKSLMMLVTKITLVPSMIMKSLTA
jgi:hypothetical protein